MEIKDLYTPKEFCAAVRISYRHYFRLRKAGEGPRVIVLGGLHRISRDELERWLAVHTERRYIDVY